VQGAWGADNLSEFLEQAYRSQHGNREKYAAQYDVVARVNECFVKVGKNLVRPEPPLAGMLFLRAQYAFKTAVGLVLSGQCVDTFTVMRSCLEYAGYSLVIFDDPTASVVFASRHVDDASMKAQKVKFTVAEVKRTISKYDKKLCEVFDDMYNRSINFGGHPNPHGAFSMMELDEASKTIFTYAITTDPKVILHAFKSVAQVGLTALFILQHVFKAKFELLGVRADMDALRGAGL
jgi:hypothetical protein